MAALRNISNDEKLSVLADKVVDKLDELLEKLEVNLNCNQKKYFGRCPIHDGNNAGALNLYLDGYAVKGYWCCRTHKCEETFKKTIIGFIRGVLSKRLLNWAKPGDKTVSFQDTINWLCKFLQIKYEDIKVCEADIERRKFAQQIKICAANVDTEKGISKEVVRNSLQIPAQYYLQRGYSRNVLEKYDVGYCNKQGRYMFGRVVVPIYDNNYKVMIGCTGRSVYDECKKCESFHSPNAPCTLPAYKNLHTKWKHNKNFSVSNCLYNYWFAKQTIKDSKTVILVEGPGDVWKLEEAGVTNSVAIFGVSLSDAQQIILECSGAMKVVLLLDNDPSGREAINGLTALLSRCYNICVPQYSKKDIGEMTTQEIKGELRC